jgi:hypothetical protein
MNEFRSERGSILFGKDLTAQRPGIRVPEASRGVEGPPTAGDWGLEGGILCSFSSRRSTVLLAAWTNWGWGLLEPLRPAVASRPSGLAPVRFAHLPRRRGGRASLRNLA